MLQPKLLSKIWAALGLKNSIPDSRSDGLAQGAATYDEGFPSITMTPIAQGGKAPSGKDMNGVLNELSAHIVHLNKGGLYKFDVTFAGKINGYDKGAVLLNDAETAFFVSLLSQNKHNFNTSSDYSKYWAKLADVQSVKHITPLKLTSQTQNTLLSNGHTHEIEKASLTEVGITQLFSGLDSNAENMAATPKAIKILKGLIDAITRNLGNYIPNSKKSNAVNSNSADTVATSVAVKTAYDKGVEAKFAADNAQRTANAKQSPATTLDGYGITDGALAKGLTTENLNAVTTVGLYGQKANVNATRSRNYPDNKAGSLVVSDSAYGVMQIYTTHDTKYTYIRNQEPSGWSGWERVDGLGKLPLEGGELSGNVSIRGNSDYNSISLINTIGYELIITSKPNNSSTVGDIIYRDDRNSNISVIRIPRKNGTMVLGNEVHYKDRFRHSKYPNHYNGAEVYKIPMSDTGGLMIITMRADVTGSTTLNLPESYKLADYSVTASDVGEGRFSLGANRTSGNRIMIHSTGGRTATVSVQCIGWVDF
ncbi:tail fiber protein [Mannheimia sp. AT1]|uniref:Tail fiber protein n=1 Tax=Mannheimia cairinae TaxID=3025936 RepID=A0ABT5MUV1_9PAST|nr:tail fiber protein [Mannheimia cairinae]MDD0824677.1 tail fiber protein [Mannheimia cairinae]MDD0826394.1 tail fiber protein [Mannheimia cairinae]